MRKIDLRAVKRTAIALVLLATSPFAFAEQPLDAQDSERSVANTLNEIVEKKICEFSDSESSPSCYGRCVVTSKTDKFTDEASHFIECYEPPSGIREEYMQLGYIMPGLLLRSDSLSMSCDRGVSLQPWVRSQFHSGTHTRVRYRFDKHDHVEQNWMFNSYGNFAIYEMTNSEWSEFLHKIASSDQLIFEVGDAEGRINFGVQTNDALAEFASRCDVETN